MKAIQRSMMAKALARRLSTEDYGMGAVHDVQARAWSILGHAQREAAQLQEAEAAGVPVVPGIGAGRSAPRPAPSLRSLPLLGAGSAP